MAGQVGSLLCGVCLIHHTLGEKRVAISASCYKALERRPSVSASAQPMGAKPALDTIVVLHVRHVRRKRSHYGHDIASVALLHVTETGQTNAEKVDFAQCLKERNEWRGGGRWMVLLSRVDWL